MAILQKLEAKTCYNINSERETIYIDNFSSYLVLFKHKI